MPLVELHPLRQEMEPRWKKARAAYLGGRHWYGQGETFKIGPFTIRRAQGDGTLHDASFTLSESNYLWRFPREKDDRYKVRLRSSVYENVFRPFVDMKAATIAKACRKCELPTAIEYMENDVDRWGMDLAMFRRLRLAWAQVYGHVFTLLAKPEGGSEQPPSRMHQLAAGIRTYAQLLSPLDMLDWSWDASAHEFKWALVQEQRPLDRLPPDERSADALATRATQCLTTCLYKPGEWIRYEDGVEVDRGPTGVDFVPIAVQFAAGRDPECAEPFGIDVSGDVADKAEEKFNKESWLTDQEANQCFSQAVIDNDDISTEELERLVGTCTYIQAKNFAWVAPDVAPMEHLSASIDRDVSTMRQMMGIETKGETSQAAKSGVALQLEQQSMSSMFAGESTAAESGERMLWRMAAVMEGGDPEQVSVEYAKDFSALDLASRFNMLVVAMEKGSFTGKAKAELQKALFVASLPDTEQEDLDEVFADIDEAAATLDMMPMPGVPGSTVDPETGEPIPIDEEADAMAIGKPVPPKGKPFGGGNPFARGKAA